MSTADSLGTAGLSVGQHTLWVQADGWDYVAESDESNNWRSFTFDVVAPETSGFDIDVTYSSGLTQALRGFLEEAMSGAIDNWRTIIRSDLPDAGTVDDLLVHVRVLSTIDGAGRIFAQAGPTGLRDGDRGLPWSGVVEFDGVDLSARMSAGDMRLVEMISTHEIGHVLGLGTLWDWFGFVGSRRMPIRKTGRLSPSIEP